MHSIFGQWDGPSLFGVTTGSRATLAILLLSQSDPAFSSLGRLMVRHDDYDVFGGATLINPQAYSRFLSIAASGASLTNGLIRSQLVPWVESLIVGLSLEASNWYLNQTAVDLRYWGAQDIVDFLNTAELLSVQVLDGVGNDISAFMAAQLDNGRFLATGAVLTGADAVRDLRHSVEALTMAPLNRPLLVKLEQALAALARNDDPAACGMIGAFVNQIHVARGQTIPAITADAWLAQSHRILSTLAC